MATNTNNPFGKLTNYVLNPQQEEQKQPVQQPAQYAQAATLQQPAQPQTQQPIQPRQQPAPQMFGQPQQPQPAQPRQTTMTPVTAGQRYTQMLQQNVPQAQAVASGLAQQVTAPAAAAQRGFEEAQKQFAKTVAEKGLTRSTQRTQELVNKAASGQELTPEELGELQKISTTRESFGEGTRPEDFMQLQEYVTALGEAQKARQYAGLTGTGAGRQQLLQQAARTPAYTSGQALMDALLAGGTAPAAQQLQQVQQRFGPTQDELAAAQQRMAEEAQRVKGEESTEIESAYKDIQDLLDAEGTGALANLEKTIQDRVAAENKKVEETNKFIDTVVPNIGLVLGDTKEEKKLMADLGIKAGSNLARYIEGSPKDTSLVEKLKEVNPQAVTSKEELKKLQQLYKIANLVKREKPELIVQEDEDLGNLADQKIKLAEDEKTLKSKYETRQKDIRNAADDLRNAYSVETIKDYKFGPAMTAAGAAKDIYNRLVTGKISNDDPIEAQKVIDKANKMVDEINKMYREKGYKVRIGDSSNYYTPQLSTNPSSYEIDKEAAKMAKNAYGWMFRNFTPEQILERMKKVAPDNYKRIMEHAAKAATVRKAASYLNANMKELK